ncbi:MAG: hypothetical protein ACREQ5_13090 [Candidatus Dormibacteria bacterium]
MQLQSDTCSVAGLGTFLDKFLIGQAQALTAALTARGLNESEVGAAFVGLASIVDDAGNGFCALGNALARKQEAEQAGPLDADERGGLIVLGLVTCLRQLLAEHEKLLRDDRYGKAADCG